MQAQPGRRRTQNARRQADYFGRRPGAGSRPGIDDQLGHANRQRRREGTDRFRQRVATPVIIDMLSPERSARTSNAHAHALRRRRTPSPSSYSPDRHPDDTVGQRSAPPLDINSRFAS